MYKIGFLWLILLGYLLHNKLLQSQKRTEFAYCLINNIILGTLGKPKIIITQFPVTKELKI